MRGQEHKPDHFARHALIQQIAHGKEVAQGLGHLLALDLQHLIMHPDLGKAVACAGALGDLILMMRELQIVAAPMNVKALAQQLMRHGRAFDVPARTPPPPRAVPARQIVIRRLPEHKIHWIPLVRSHFDTRTGDHVFDRPARQGTVIGVALYGEKHMALSGIGVPFGDQILTHGDHLANVARRPRLMVGTERAQSIHIGVIPANGFFCAL